MKISRTGGSKSAVGELQCRAQQQQVHVLETPGRTYSGGTHQFTQGDWIIQACTAVHLLYTVSTCKSVTYRSGVLTPKMPDSPAYTRWLESMDFT